jgi:hypothetical protein
MKSRKSLEELKWGWGMENLLKRRKDMEAPGARLWCNGVHRRQWEVGEAFAVLGI